MNQFFLWKTKDLWFLMAIFNHNFSSFWEQPVPSKKQPKTLSTEERIEDLPTIVRFIFHPIDEKGLPHKQSSPSFYFFPTLACLQNWITYLLQVCDLLFFA